MPVSRSKPAAIVAAMALSACMPGREPLVDVRVSGAREGSAVLDAVPPGGRVSPKQAARELLSDIMFGSEEQSLAAGMKLDELADASVAPVLLDGLRRSRPGVQLHCARALANIDEKSAVPLIISLAEGSHPYKQDLVFLLGEFGDARAIPLLERELGSDDPAMRSAAAEALGKTGSAAPGARLIDLVKDKEAPVRKAAIVALGRLGVADASLPLLKAIEDKTDYVRASAVEALGGIGEPAIELLLDAIVSGNPDYRLEYMESLMAMGGKAVPPLVAALDRPEAVLRSSIVRALGNIRDQRATAALIGALEDPDGAVRGDAANALRMLGAAGALPKLSRLAATDPNEFVRAASEAAVRSISGK